MCAAVAVTATAILKFAAAASAAGFIWIHLCGSYTQGSGSTGGTLGVARSGSSNPGVSTPYECPPSSASASAYGMEAFGGGSGVPAGGRAYWEIDAPSGLVIVGFHTEGSGMVSYGVNQNMGWGGGFYWQGGGAGASPGEVGYSSPALFTSYIGWQIICGWSTCNGASKPGEISILGPPPVCQTPHGLRVNGKYIIEMFKRVILCNRRAETSDTVRIGDTLRDEHPVM